MEAIVIDDEVTGKAEMLRAAAVFIATGFDANTEAYRTAVDVDESGFIQTPHGLQTSMAGVYAAGLARSGSVKSPEEAAREGVHAVSLIREYLDQLSLSSAPA